MRRWYWWSLSRWILRSSMALLFARSPRMAGERCQPWVRSLARCTGGEEGGGGREDNIVAGFEAAVARRSGGGERRTYPGP